MIDLPLPSAEATSVASAMAALGALLKAFYSDWCARQDKLAVENRLTTINARVDQRFADQQEMVKELMAVQNKRLDEQDEEIEDHAVLVARDYVTRSEIQKLQLHIDAQFTETRTLIFNALTGKSN